ncbi:MAG TPA: monovalent cation/H+ antiporter complex subunit F [Desulfobacterales bacterium]|nr:monovalent cation/H+ antiporter complex subunit F [Desulfobacterales bacterium]
MILSHQLMAAFFLVSSLAGLYRVLRGPSSADRLVGLNLVAAQVLAILVVVAVDERRDIYLDVALVYDIFGFVGVLAIARYLGARAGHR